MKFIRSRKFDLEGDLRAYRAEPSSDFTKALAAEVRSRPAERTRLGRVGLAIALSGLIVVALASFGGVGYASSAASHAAKKPTVAKQVRIVTKSAAQAQYGPFQPPATPKAEPKATGQAAPVLKPPKAKVTATAAPKATPKAVAAGAAKAEKAPTVTSSQLPFTGLALWIPLAAGLMLIAFGLVLRTRGRRHGSSAH